MQDKTMAGAIIGVDISKARLDLCAAGGAGGAIANTPAAIAAWLDQAQPALVAFEATGGYERDLRHALLARAIRFVQVHANTVLAFRRGRGIKAKTDRIDARLIAAFAAETLTRRPPAPAIVADDALRDLSQRRRQLVEALHAERCRLALARQPAVHASLERMLARLQADLQTIEAEIAARIAESPKTARLDRLLKTLTGVGPVTAMTRIADLPELGRLSSKQIASLVGLAPLTRRSGTLRPRERTGFGRPAVRRVLFNAARAAIRHAGPLRAFYDRLVTENQRPGKVALTALMRKMLVILNAIARDNTPWSQASPT